MYCRPRHTVDSQTNDHLELTKHWGYPQFLYILSAFQGCDRDCQKECIAVHNKYRANHGAPPLVFDQKLADEAQALIDKGVFKHSDWVELKNNGAAFAWGSLFPTFTAVIKNWHDEGTYYDYQTGAPKKQSQVKQNTNWVEWYLCLEINLLA